jgi:YVTN family beta-propeller protein
VRAMSGLPSGTVTFLFTDIEGSTQLVKRLGGRYSEVHAEHQRILRAAFAAHDGHEVDTQGDSFFVAFRRAKDAVAAAVAAQRDVAAHAWPDGADVKVRMGLHTGEPHVGEDRYVGLGVHKAARIAAAGHGGQVLLSRTTRELVEDELPPGVTIRDLGERRLKDLERPEQLSQLVVEGLPSEFGSLKTLDVELARRRRRMYAGAALIGVLAAAVAIPVFALGQRSGGSSATVEPNSLAIIDPASNKVSGSVPTGVRPSSVAGGAGSIWVANLDDRTLSRIDPKTQSVQRTLPLDATPTGIASGSGAIWVANGLLGTVSRVDPSIDDVTETIDVTERSSSGAVAVGEGFVWAVYGNSVLGKIDPRGNQLLTTGVVGASPSAIAEGERSVWVANSGDNTVSRILPETAGAVGPTTVGRQPSGIAVGEGAVWVADRGDDLVTRIDASSGSATTISVGRAPFGIAVGVGAVWVANSDDGTVSRIDPVQKKEVERIQVGSRPVGVTVSDGRVWVTVQAPLS